MRALRRRYWESLPTRAYRIRRLVRAAREGTLELGEREELELLTQRLAESGASYGFQEVSRIVGDILDEIRAARSLDSIDFATVEKSCDELDRFIDDMTFEVLATRLRAALT